MDREKGRGGGGYERSRQEKEARRLRWVKRPIQIGVVV